MVAGAGARGDRARNTAAEVSRAYSDSAANAEAGSVCRQPEPRRLLRTGRRGPLHEHGCLADGSAFRMVWLPFAP